MSLRTVLGGTTSPPPLFNDAFINVKDYGAVGNGVTVDTTAIQTALNLGGNIYFPEGEYIVSTLTPVSDSCIVFHPKAKLTVPSGGGNVLRFNTLSDVTIYCNNAEFYCNTTGTSHCISLWASTRCSIFDVNITNTSTDHDGIYVGKSGTICSDINIIRGKIAYAKRNGISVCGGTRVLIDGVEISYTSGAPGSGIDIEANAYNDVYDVTVQNCYTHDNEDFGIIGTFGDRYTIRDNISYNEDGIAFSSVSTAWLQSVHRPQDLRGVESFSVSDGWISIYDAAKAGDAGIEIGSVVEFIVENGATLPAELIATDSYVVCEKDSATDTKIKVASYFNYSTISSFSSAGTGTMNLDHDLSDIWVQVINTGVTSNILIEGNVILSPLTDGLLVSHGINVTLRDNIIYQGVNLDGIFLYFCKRVHAENNIVYGNSSSTGSDTYGIYASHCSYVTTSKNSIFNTRNSGIKIKGCTNAVMKDDIVSNCGISSGIAVSLQNGVNPFVSGVTVINEPRNSVTYGIQLDSSVTYGLVTGCFLKGCGSTDANALILSSTTCKGRFNIGKNGQFEADEN